MIHILYIIIVKKVFVNYAVMKHIGPTFLKVMGGVTMTNKQKETIKIKVCKDYDYYKTLFYNDNLNLRCGVKSTLSSNHIKFCKEDVSESQLLDYIKKGYAIKINY